MIDKNPPIATTTLSQAQRAAIISLVRRTARAEVLPRFQNLAAGQLDTKSGPDDLVTEADKASEAMLTRGLNVLFPGAFVVGEEAIASKPDMRHQIAEADLAFIIDPIDGTWNFAHDLPLFGVILSATRYGRPVFGLLYDPISDDWIIAHEGDQTCREGEQYRRRSLRLSGQKKLGELSGFVHLNLLPEHKKPEMAAQFPRFRRVTALRCSCHEYRLLAQGAADFHISGTLNPWDHAAGVLCVQQAGGVAKMLDGEPYNTKFTNGYLLIAPDEDIWEKLQACFAFLTS
ncbi:MAG: inositol monophosphatase, partial [Pseudomonadota bacterium]